MKLSKEKGLFMIFTAKGDPHARYDVQLSEINRMIKEDPERLIQLTERYYSEQIQNTAQQIKNTGQHIVLLSGPSGSGKTTTADKLKICLSAFGKTAHVVSLDDFFLGKGRYPKLPDGRDNFESVYALDLQLIRKTICDMLDKGFARMPRFDFGTSERINNAYELTVGENDIVIFEGIHALNPILLPENHGADAHKMYVSPKCTVLDGEEKIISGKDLRLTRRMIRDRNFRHYAYQQTVAIWDNVLDGERENITPFANTADSVVDTTHFYEYGLYSAYLATVQNYDGLEKEMATVVKIKKKFDRFSFVSPSIVPNGAMIREFIGKDEKDV